MFTMRYIGLSISLMTNAAFADALHICVDKTPSPPFVYSEKINGAGQLRGYSLDLVKQLLTSVGRTYDIKSLASPEIEKKIQNADPKSGCDVVLDVAKTPAKEAFLLLTPPVYSLNYDLMYNWERYMTGLGVKSLADVAKLKACGVSGYDYSAVGKDLKIKLLDNVKDAVFELKHKTCDVFVAEGVVMRYGQRMNNYQVPPVGCVRLDGTSKNYHIGIAKHVVGASALLGKIQQQLIAPTTKKTIAALAETYDVNTIACQQTLRVSP
ncbi:MAG: transporter substrate-binding domain-containing protein [Agitococcus sp.]|nr:transporter substrate-binding domain-containing protein [Agitococcus sp.]